MDPDHSANFISIMRGPYNTYHAEAFDLIFKLSYASVQVDKPWLEIFLNDDDAKSGEWDIYGALLDDGDDRFANVKFSAVGESQDFTIKSLPFQIRFERFHQEPFTYPNGSAERAPVYDFLVRSLP